jgi:hypothetical protein
MEHVKNPKECCFDNNFINSINILNLAEEKYKLGLFEESLCLLENSLEEIEMPSTFILSKYYDITASILWKLGEREKSYYLWKKSLHYDGENRHSSLSLSILFDQTEFISDICELFIQIKLNEFLSQTCESCGNVFDRIDEEKIINYLLHFWENNLSSTKLEKMDELELVDYFINIKVF